MNDDVRLSRAITGAGAAPTPEFRAALRERLADEAAGRTTVSIDGDRTSDGPSRRSPWLVAGVAAAATVVLVTGLALATRRDDDPSPAVLPDRVTVEPGGDTAPDLAGHRWVAVDIARTPAPTLSFEPAADAGALTVDLYDGCNQGSGTITVDGGTVSTAEIATTKIGCPFDQSVPVLVGTTFTLDAADDGRLTLLVTTGDATTSYVALDSMTPAAASRAVEGTWWHPGTRAITFTPNDPRPESGGVRLDVGTCQALGTIDDGFFSATTPVEAACVDDPEADAELIPRLTDAATRWYRYDDNRLLMATDVGVELFNIYTTLVTPGEEADPGSFADAVARRTYVLMPTATERESARPYVSFGSPDDPESAFEGFTGCASLLGRGTWIETTGGFDLDGSLSIGTGACAAELGQFEISDGTSFATDGTDHLLVTTGARIWQLVAVDTLPIATPDQIEGRWAWPDGSDDVVIDATSGTLSIGDCTIGLDPDGNTVGPWSDPACAGTELSLTQALDPATPFGGTNVMRITDGFLIIESRSAERIPLVFALRRIGPLTDPDTISFEAGSALGFLPGDVVTAGEIEAHVSSILGPPTHDTGWFVTPHDPTITDHEDCMGGNTTRVLWWHDLSFVVWQFPDGSERLFAWSVGDILATRFGDRREPYLPDPGDRSNVTSDGTPPIGLGTPADDVLAAYPDLQQAAIDFAEPNDRKQLWQVGPVTIILLDGRVIGFGNEQRFC